MLAKMSGTVKCVCMHKWMMYLWFVLYFALSLCLVFLLIYIYTYISYSYVLSFYFCGVQTIVFELQVFLPTQFVNAILPK